MNLAIEPVVAADTDKLPLRPDVDWTLTRVRDRALDMHIAAWVREGDRVLDLGCGEGDLLDRLKKDKSIREMGVEIEGHAVTEAIARGLSVVHDDLGDTLSCQDDYAFDVVILNQVITTIEDPVDILEQSLRVGHRVVVTFPNFAHWKNPFHIFLFGRLPVNPSLPYQWFDTPNIRLVTVKDFRDLCRDRSFRIEGEEFVAMEMDGRVRTIKVYPNMRASSALFLLSGGRRLQN